MAKGGVVDLILHIGRYKYISIFGTQWDMACTIALDEGGSEWKRSVVAAAVSPYGKGGHSRETSPTFLRQVGDYSCKRTISKFQCVGTMISMIAMWQNVVEI
jgi:hypothetical protein